MAFSLRIRIGCTGSDHSFAKFGIDNNCSSLCGGAPRPVSVMFSGDQSRSRGQNRRVTAAAPPAMAVTGFQKDYLGFDMETRGANDRAEGRNAADATDRLDRWMRDSVVEIVKNLREAPLLMQVFPKGHIDGDDNNGDHMMATATATGTATLVTEKRAMEENWPEAKGKWRREMAPLPEGLILVEELTGEEQTEGREDTTKVWGVVVQGRRAGCWPVCYLLKTTRVRSCESGPCSTHYCLTRVKNLMGTVDSQFKNLWLVQSQKQ